MILFNDRIDAGTKLSGKIHLGKDEKKPIVLGIPRGGIAVGYPIASKLRSPLEPVTLRKLPIPQNDQMGFGAVTLDRKVILNTRLVDAGYVRREEIDAVVDEVYEEVLRRDRIYRGSQPFPELTGRTVLIVDDGLATGFTMLAAIGFARDRGAMKIICAVPVAHDAAYGLIEREVDSIVCLHVDRGFSFAVASFYRDFPDMDDGEVVSLLRRIRGKTGNRLHLPSRGNTQADAS
ncbi:MAG TPA: phosphoribosyltransferase family protein [Syntrophales bacterium]|nr:phosphoribosyltransferase family protein [Syntrophales bacterium]